MDNAKITLDKLQIAVEALKVAAECLHGAKCLSESVTTAFSIITKAIVSKTISLGAHLN